MNNSSATSVLVFAAANELPANERIWGTGGWMEPATREALDWVTLARLLGWGTEVRNLESVPALASHYQWVILACNPDVLPSETIDWLQSLLAQRAVTVVARAAQPGTYWSRLAGAVRGAEQLVSRELVWIGPGPERIWHCRKPLTGNRLRLAPGTMMWTSLSGNTVVAARRLGAGTIATLAFHPSEARDTDGAASALLQHLLIWSAPPPVAWLDFNRTLILRMDDPGSSENVHHRIYSHTKLSEDQWKAVGTILRHHKARLSIGYVSGWVDDGDSSRGELFVNQRKPPRVAGAIHPSPQVRYAQPNGASETIVHDYAAEFRGIQRLRGEGLAEVELHGYTHMHPHTAAWAKAPDRYHQMQWYRELGEPASAAIAARPAEQHPLALALTAFHGNFGTHPSTLISPGDQWTNQVLIHALELGLQLVSSYYLALRDSGRFCWSQHLCAPYLDRPDPSWFDSGLPVVGYFHDFDLAINGVEWLSRWLEEWVKVGVGRMIDLREFAAAVSRQVQIEKTGSDLRLRVFTNGAAELVRPLCIGLRLDDENGLTSVSVESENRIVRCPIENGRGDSRHLTFWPSAS